MKLSGVPLFLCALSLVDGIVAYPDMKKTIRDIEELATKRSNGKDDGDDDPVLIGDVQDGGKTPVGKTVARILLKKESGESYKYSYDPPGPAGSPKCKADTCCVWYHISKHLETLFTGPYGRCNGNARSAIRLGFHDAGTWKSGLNFAGADGSIALSDTELTRIENRGLQAITEKLLDVRKKFDIGVADLIQFAAKHAVVVCPLGPRIRTFVGRKDSDRANPEGLIPSPFDSADKTIPLFRNKTISPHDLVALLGAHSTSRQNFVDPNRGGAPQDTTPGVWDTLYYAQTLERNPPQEVFRFPSDISLANDKRTAEEFREFAEKGAQDHWDKDYAHAYIRLSMLGVNNINQLTECTKVLPEKKNRVRNPKAEDGSDMSDLDV